MVQTEKTVFLRTQSFGKLTEKTNISHLVKTDNLQLLLFSSVFSN